MQRGERLIQLLENANGNNVGPGVLLMAAKQLGELASNLLIRDMDAQVNEVLDRVTRLLLLSKQWDVRVAACRAVEAILLAMSANDQTSFDVDMIDPKESIASLNLPSIIETFQVLVSSSGTEFDVDFSVMDAAERNRQRERLKKTLEIMDGQEDYTADLLKDEAEQVVSEESSSTMTFGSTRQLSSREKAMERRKMAKQTLSHSDQISKPMLKLEMLKDTQLSSEMATKSAWMRVLLVMCANLLNVNWQVRHGAAMGLRSLFSNQSLLSNQKYKETIALLTVPHLLSLLALDRFCDFVGDCVMVPVRETAAQVLAAIFANSSILTDAIIWEKVIQLASWEVLDEWQVRHSGLLAIKYLSAISTHTTDNVESKLSQMIVSLALKASHDEDGDVCSLALDVLAIFRSSENHHVIGEVLQRLLIPIDDSETVSENVLIKGMQLLKSICLDLSSLVVQQMTVPWARHSSATVKSLVVDILGVLINNNNNDSIQFENHDLVLRVLVQNIVLDNSPTLRTSSRQIASTLLDNKAFPTKQTLSSLVSLTPILLTPATTPFDSRHFVYCKISHDNDQSIISTCEPPHYEMGFKPADILVTKRTADSVEFAETRFEAASIVSRIALFYNQDVSRRLIDAMVNEESGVVGQCIARWIFGDRFAVTDVSTNFTNLWHLRLQCDSTDDAVLLIEHIKLEPVAGIQTQIAHRLSSMMDAENCSEFLQLIVHSDTRCRAIKVLSQCDISNVVLTKMSHSLQKKSADLLIALHIIMSARLEFDENLVLSAIQSNKTDTLLIVELLVRQTDRHAMVAFVVSQVTPLLTTTPALRLSVIKLLHQLFNHEANLEFMQTSGSSLLFLIPCLQRIGDADAQVRSIAMKLFSQLLCLVPLASGSTLKPEWTSHKFIQSKWIEAKEFVQCFLENTASHLTDGRRAQTIPEFSIPVEINATLRPYQQIGVNWLAFLHRYGMHGALCDDMGLGKTLQTICMMASSHWMNQQQGPELIRPSLVICPSSLVGHWKHEIETYAGSTLTDALTFLGSAEHRSKLLEQAKSSSSSVIIASYDAARTEIANLSQIHWNYLVLDEGHYIRNPKSKTSLALRSLIAEHRLLLSGTPIQNNVTELWTLFDFLMPDLLGSESQFMENYGKAIAAVQPTFSTGNQQKSQASVSVQDFERAEQRMQDLNRQVLPFILRRMKEDVLDDLPPKIIQDFECDMSRVQRLLYDAMMKNVKPEDEDLSTAIMQSSSDEKITDVDQLKVKPHFFQTLRYLIKLCTHPLLVVDQQHPQWLDVQNLLAEMGISSLEDLAVAPKLALLRELLVECGVLSSSEEASDNTCTTDVSSHRVLIFAQTRKTLDYVQRFVLHELSAEQYLRIDGSVPSKDRFDIAQRFNQNESVRALLLTTQCGGLGLNLTGADTVIFVEHDWNPQNDLQAMDRAHRLGQKRTVNVYRIIVRDTVEQHIMGLQRWKTRIAATVIKQQGDAEQQSSEMLDILAKSSSSNQKTIQDPQSSKSKKRKTTVIGDAEFDASGNVASAEGDNDTYHVTDDDDDYDKEFDMALFLQQTLK